MQVITCMSSAGIYLHVNNAALPGRRAKAGAVRRENDEEDDKDTATWVQAAIEYEHRFSESPFSVFAVYQADFIWQQEAEDCCDESVVASTFQGWRAHAPG